MPVASDVHSWERRLSAAQRRYLGACESLARIRKLAGAAPALQVTFAAADSRPLTLCEVPPEGRGGAEQPSNSTDAD